MSLTNVWQDYRKILEDRYSPRFYQHVFSQIPKGLDAIHLIRWVHRDIHPGNILILPPAAQIRHICIKIADFGSAREIRSIMEAYGSQTVPSELSYTLPWGAPGEGTGRYSYKVGIFSAGLVLCQISCDDWRRQSSAPRPLPIQTMKYYSASLTS